MIWSRTAPQLLPHIDFFLPSHYKEHTSPVAQKFMQLITWTWHPVFIKLCSVVRDAKSFTPINITAVQKETALSVQSVCFGYQMRPRGVA